MAVELQISPPPLGGRVLVGPVTFTVTLTSPVVGANYVRVRYGDALVAPQVRIRNNGPTNAPYVFTWDARHEWPQRTTFVAEAVTAEGGVLGASTPVDVELAPEPGQVFLDAVDAAGNAVDLDAPLQGQVTIHMRAVRADGVVQPWVSPTQPVGDRYVHVRFEMTVDGKTHGLHPRSGAMKDEGWTMAQARSNTNLAEEQLILDTSRFADGAHTLTLVASTEGPDVVDPSSLPPNALETLRRLAFVQRTVTFANSTAMTKVVRELRPQYGVMYLEVNQQSTLDATFIHTDGTTGAPASVTRTSLDPAVVEVLANGALRGVAPGATRVTVSSGGRVGEVQVVVVADANAAPHFAKDGAILTSYDAARSVYPRSVFQLGRHPLVSDVVVNGVPDVAQAVKQVKLAHVNTLEDGFFYNGADHWMHPSGTNPVVRTYAEWESVFVNEVWEPIRAIAEQHGFYLWLIGDGMLRTRNEARFTLGLPVTSADGSVTLEQAPYAPGETGFGLRAAAFAFKKAKESGRVIGADMVDEANMLWGGEPFPANSKQWYANPGSSTLGPYDVPHDFFAKLLAAINANVGNPGRIPITWPSLALADAVGAGKWMGPEAVAAGGVTGEGAFANFATIYATSAFDRGFYPNLADRKPPFRSEYRRQGPSLLQQRYAHDTTRWGWMPKLQTDRPVMLVAGLTGSFYQKLLPGGQYQVAGDRELAPGQSPVRANAEILYGVATGGMGMRCYFYDHAQNRIARQGTPATARGAFEQGANPFHIGTDRWQAMGAAYEVTARVEDLLFGAPRNAPDLGEAIVTGVRQRTTGPGAGTLFTALNASERPETVTIDLTPYMPAANGTVVRYRARAMTFGCEHVAAPVHQLTLQPGETALYCIRGEGLHTAAVSIGAFEAKIPPGDVHMWIGAQLTGPTAPVRLEIAIDGGTPVTTTSNGMDVEFGSARRNVWVPVTVRAVHPTDSRYDGFARSAIWIPETPAP